MQKNKKLFIIVIILIIFTSCNKKPINDVIIAHAGGAIDGYTYTNSLEAMNLSYEKGCRLFELDIITTSDEKFVAAHGWKDFKNFTGYNETSNTPLTEEEVMSKKILGKYSPMNMEMINKWFKKHKKAILITDKINNPKLFCEHFHYKDRLIMELFSWKAVEDAINEGIKPMVSQNLIKINPETEQKLLDLKIEYVGVSMWYFFNNRDFFKRLKDLGIKTYVFSLSKTHDERYLLENELDYIHGIYADNIDIMKYFNSTKNH